MKLPIVLVLAFGCRLLFAGQQDASINNAADLTSIIVSNQAECATLLGKPFKIVCSVISVGPEFILSDATGRALVLTDQLPQQPTGLKRGDVVNAEGHLQIHSSGRLLPFATAIKKIRNGQPPKTHDASGADFVSGRYDYQPVRIRGQVLDIITDEIDPNYAIIIIDCDGERIPSSVLISKTEPIVGEPIETEGICQPSPTISRQMIGRMLVNAKFRHLRGSSADTFDVPELTCCRFRQPKELSSIDRRRLRGRVIAVWNHAALVRTADRLVARLELIDGKRPSCGDAIEAAGLPETDLYMPRLRRAHWRAIDDSLLPMDEAIPQDVAFASIFLNREGHSRFNSLLNGTLIRMTTKVRSLPSANGQVDYMLVGSDEWMLPVDISSAIPRPVKLTVDSTVEITGIYLLDCQPWRPNTPIPPVNGVKIIVRSSDDIRILSTPPWWTVGRLLVVVGILGAILLFVIIWNLTLQRVAERRGRKLSAERIARAEAEIKTMERTRLAVELHDTIAQNLTGVSIALDVARQFCQGTKTELRQQIDIADATLDSCQVELRNCLWDLRNQALEEADLNTAIRTALQPHVADAALDIRFNVARDRLTENTTHVILRIIRELVINAMRHGHATHIQIAGAIDPDALRFSVRDNGCGFEVDRCPGIAQRHFGLQGIRERLSLLGGKMDVDSALDVGTRVVVSIPLPQCYDSE